MRILITGHRGYVGSVLAPLLQRGGHQLLGLDADWYSRCQLYPLTDPVLSWTRKDIRDIEVSDLAGVDAVIHLAALSNDPLGDLDPAVTHEINAEAAIRLADCARRAGVGRFLATSSCSIYGAAGDQWIDEQAKPAPETAYAESKLAMESGVRSLSSDDFAVVIVRPGTVFGPSPMLRFDLVLNNLVAWAVATGVVHFKSDGRAWRPLLHVEDLAAALKFLIEAPAPQVADRAFNVGFNDRNLRVRDLGSIVQSLLPGSRVDFGENAGVDSRSYRVDCDRLASVWRPADGGIEFSAGVHQLIKCLRQHPVSVDEFEGQRFQRVAHLKEAIERGWLDERLRCPELMGV